MKFCSVSAILLALLLTACGEKEGTESAESEAAPATEAAEGAVTEVAAPAEAAPASQGGYEPKPEERVPGITMTKEEVEKMVAEGLADTPKPMIPGEAAPAEAAPVEAAK